MAAVRGILQQDEHAVVILAGGAAEIGVELARTELGRGERQAQIVLAANLTAANRPCADIAWCSSAKRGGFSLSSGSG
ncbi:hypothetical protein [Bradyrhizobium cenepequi]|uniref:hypothetical protein n=1 Tax=Bradyrhizobium cenepequi TaxID=2821403 RepID=UPI001CE26626|nr:hypothetical protein [Bradyrhizobium cenepequi]MCA6110806.1 hypothetical protein [Bradyrhizobium cenepequi]